MKPYTENMNHTVYPDERLLIGALKNGSRKAFDEIYGMYAKRLLAYCKQYTKRWEDAEEIVQDVFVRLWNSRTSIRQEETLRSLLFIIAKHYLINAYRANVNSPAYEEYVACRAEPAPGAYSCPLEYEDFLRKLRAALRKLPPAQRKIIELSRLKGLSNKEVAEEAGVSEQTVKNQLSQGLKSLREELDKIAWIAGWLLIVN